VLIATAAAHAFSRTLLVHIARRLIAPKIFGRISDVSNIPSDSGV
jgi:hypothetical protein